MWPQPATSILFWGYQFLVATDFCDSYAKTRTEVLMFESSAEDTVCESPRMEAVSYILNSAKQEEIPIKR